nr:hypothetical protein BaRGS_021057 [Batillaria attramentaria]
MFTAVNYVLMFASVIIIGGLASGLVYLYIRELGLTRRKHKQDLLVVLRRRRQAFSGQSGRPDNCNDVSLSARATYNNTHVGLELDSDGEDTEGQTDLEPATNRTQVLYDGMSPT